jgi:hypothetical protein
MEGEHYPGALFTYALWRVSFPYPDQDVFDKSELWCAKMLVQDTWGNDSSVCGCGEAN